MTVTRDDYFISTSATWRALPLPWVRALMTARKQDISTAVRLGNHHYQLDYKSRSSWYWVSADGRFLIRLSDHWSSGSSSINCGRIRDCRWRLDADCGAIHAGAGRDRYGWRPVSYTAGIVSFSSMARLPSA